MGPTTSDRAGGAGGECAGSRPTRHAVGVTLSAEELYRRGVDHGNAGRNAAARRSLTSALARTDDPDLRARIAGTLSYIAARTGDPGGAERLCRQALAAPGVTPATAAILEGQLGLLAVGSGDWEAAVAWLDRAIGGIGEDPEHRNSMYLNRSVAHMQSGRLREARADLELAAIDFLAVGDEEALAMTRHNLGYVALLEGNLVPALELMTEARVRIEQGSAVNAAISDLDRAEVLRDAGLTTEAEQTLERVARTFGAHGMRQARGEAEFQLARSLLVHDPAQAARVATAADRRFRALGSQSWAARALGTRLRAELADRRVRRSGLRVVAPGRVPTQVEVDAAANDLDRLGFTADAVALRLSLELWRARHATPAGGGATGARLPRNASIQLRLLGHEVRAAHAAATGRDGEVRRHAARGLDALGQWQRAFGSLDLQTSVTMHGHGLMLEGLAAAVRSGRPDVVFEWSERARHLSQQVVALRPPPDPELADDLAELRTLRAENPTGDWLSGGRAARLRDRTRHRQWTATGAAGLDDQVTLEELRGALGARTAFATYLFDGDALSCLVVTSSGIRLLEVGTWTAVSAVLGGLRADLDVSALVTTGPMAGIVARALEARLAELAGVLTEAALTAAGDRRLVLTVPGVLAGVPWPMLPGLHGRPFSLATSATRWVRDRSRSARPGVGFAAGPGVSRGEEEVRIAASAWDSATVLRGSDATVDAVTRLASGVGVLHVAAHGRHAVDNPLFSGLELADGTLFGYDIDRMPRVPEVVVLSACEVGRSAVRWGEEAIGMTRAWLHAGARCVVATPVVVADDLACELLGGMHAGLAGGLAPAEALAVIGVPSPFQCHGSGF